VKDINYKRLFWIILALFIPTFIGMMILDEFLKTPSTEFGIVSFEFCWITESCQSALDNWEHSGQLFAMLSLGLDYLFLILYPGLIAVGIILLRSKLSGYLVKINDVVVASCVLISLSDAIENYALIQIILSGYNDSYGMVATIFASIKFVLLGIALIWLLFMLIRHFFVNKKQ